MFSILTTANKLQEQMGINKQTKVNSGSQLSMFFFYVIMAFIGTLLLDMDEISIF